MDLTVRDHALEAARPPVVVAPEDTLRVVAHRLWEADVGAAVVVDDGHSVGVISERDLVSQFAQGADPDSVTAGDAMAGVVVSARPSDTLLDVVYLMIDATIRHVPVIDDEGDIDGIISIRDVLRPLLIDTLGHSDLDPFPRHRP